MLVNITIPVYNEERRLPLCIPKLHAFLADHCRFDFEIVIADNASTDHTNEIACSYSRSLRGVKVMRLAKKGRGRAIKHVWSQSDATLMSYMDVDLSTELSCFPPLVEALQAGGYDIAIGSRLLNPSLTTRGLQREIISRAYNHLIKAFFGTRFSDAQCGFKAVTRGAVKRLLPLVEDNEWFMDTETLILGEKLGWRIFDLPVKWVDNTDSRVQIFKTAISDLRGLMRVRRTLASTKLQGRALWTPEPLGA